TNAAPAEVRQRIPATSANAAAEPSKPRSENTHSRVPRLRSCSACSREPLAKVQRGSAQSAPGCSVGAVGTGAAGTVGSGSATPKPDPEALGRDVPAQPPRGASARYRRSLMKMIIIIEL